MKKLTFEIDEAMLGGQWNAGPKELIELAEIYEEELKKEFPNAIINVIPITDSYNGAKQDEFEDNSEAWSRTLDRVPSTWWRDAMKQKSLSELYEEEISGLRKELKASESINSRSRHWIFMLKAGIEELNHREFNLKRLMALYTVSEYFVEAVKLELQYSNIWRNFSLFLREAEYIQRIKRQRYYQIKVDVLNE